MSDSGQLALLDDKGRVHRLGTDTEAAAAASMAPRTRRLRDLVLTLLRQHPAGLTDDEGGVLLAAAVPGADRLTFGRRRQDLCKAGLVDDSLRRRPTPHGRAAIVWRAL